MKNVNDFYSTVGWQEDENCVSNDTKLFEDLRPCAEEYLRRSRMRIMEFIPGEGKNFLDVGCGAIPHKEYVEFSRNFERRYCIDLSEMALAVAKRSLGDHGEYIQSDFLELRMDEDFFDCSISLHVLFHVDKEKQESFVRKLLRLTKPGGTVILVYANPHTLLGKVLSPLKLAKYIVKRAIGYHSRHLYYHIYPFSWWDRFRDVAEVSFYPYRSFRSAFQKRVFPNNPFGKRMFQRLAELEEKYPQFFVRHFEFPIVILKPLADATSEGVRSP